jgi:hypothetical protein
MNGLLAALWVIAVAPPRSAMPVYPKATPVELPGRFELDGVRYELAYFSTADGLDAVASFYEQAWRREGVPVLLESAQADLRFVCAFWTREGLSRGVLVQRHGAQTLVFELIAHWPPALLFERRGPPSAWREGAAWVQPGRSKP